MTQNIKELRRRGSFEGMGLAMVGVALLIFVLVVLAPTLFGGATNGLDVTETKTLTICDKDRASDYRVYTDDGTYVMKDSIIGGVRYSTADAYGRLKVGTTYEVEVKGWRLPFFSKFKNIINFEKVPEAQQTPEACD